VLTYVISRFTLDCGILAGTVSRKVTGVPISVGEPAAVIIRGRTA
jgi:hypothetical protein